MRNSYAAVHQVINAEVLRTPALYATHPFDIFALNNELPSSVELRRMPRTILFCSTRSQGLNVAKLHTRIACGPASQGIDDTHTFGAVWWTAYAARYSQLLEFVSINDADVYVLQPHVLDAVPYDHPLTALTLYDPDGDALSASDLEDLPPIGDAMPR